MREFWVNTHPRREADLPLLVAYPNDRSSLHGAGRRSLWGGIRGVPCHCIDYALPAPNGPRYPAPTERGCITHRAGNLLEIPVCQIINLLRCRHKSSTHSRQEGFYTDPEKKINRSRQVFYIFFCVSTSSEKIIKNEISNM